MELNQLDKNLELILKEENFSSTIKWSKIGQKIGVFDSIKGLPSVNLQTSLSSGNIKLKSRNYDLLKSLFSRLRDIEQKSFFFSRLETEIQKPIVGKASVLALLFLMKERDLVSAIVLFHENLTLLPPYLQLLDSIYDFIRCEHQHISTEDFDSLEQLMINVEAFIKKNEGSSLANIGNNLDNSLQTTRQILRQIQLAKYNRLKDDLMEGINFEINQDREVLKDNLRALDFSEDLIKSIEFVDNMYRLSDNKFQYKACADQLRSFTSGIISEVAKKVAMIYGDDIPKNKYHKYLQAKRFFLDKTELILFQSFRDYLSSNSVHKLNSPKEVARIGKNMAIELALLLSQRLKELEETQGRNK